MKMGMFDTTWDSDVEMTIMSSVGMIRFDSMFQKQVPLDLLISPAHRARSTRHSTHCQVLMRPIAAHPIPHRVLC